MSTHSMENRRLPPPSITTPDDLRLFTNEWIGMPNGWHKCFGVYKSWPACEAIMPPANFYFKNGIPLPVCQPCRQEIDQAIKEADPFTPKAYDTLTHHIQKSSNRRTSWRDLWEIKDLDHLNALHGVNVPWAAERFEIAAGIGVCCYCSSSFWDEKHRRLGFDNITLDVYDPRKPPSRSNLRFDCCATCNTEKNARTPEEWDAYLHGRRVRLAHIAQSGWKPPPAEWVRARTDNDRAAMSGFAILKLSA